ncbi:uncharacterized protein BJ212DRAFT_1302608 [Suillus subaureus]|uniref:Uncharacterized protein n=1 Tax=Suillus subaureus TaxID=48587 RepID=A0A9P7E241_9AGAM|nr:uncharacterized protein BJ212DRAFT_1302608 [Suillus subaureus]KAG1809387.1 hypothetical protein BJ212DRAFT_1302608 [Suillus subaureus]
MNDLDLSLPSRAYPSPSSSSSTYRRAGIFLAVYPLRNLICFIRSDLSRPCGINSSSIARGGNTAPILPNQSSFSDVTYFESRSVTPVKRNSSSSQILEPVDYAQMRRFPQLVIVRVLPSLQCDVRSLSTNQGPLHQSFKDQRKCRPYNNQPLCTPEIDVSHAVTPQSLLGLNFTQGFSEQNRNNSNIHRGVFFEIRHGQASH